MPSTGNMFTPMAGLQSIGGGSGIPGLNFALGSPMGWVHPPPPPHVQHPQAQGAQVRGAQGQGAQAQAQARSGVVGQAQARARVQAQVQAQAHAHPPFMGIGLGLPNHPQQPFVEQAQVFICVRAVLLEQDFVCVVYGGVAYSMRCVLARVGAIR